MLADELNDFQARFDAGATAAGVPGATLGIALGDDEASFATGLLNIKTGVTATPDSIFQIGSITKVWTTSLIMQLVDEGKVDLDAPVRTYLPNFAVADPEASRSVTVRQLVTHTSGIDGDFFLDRGRGDDCYDRYVQSMAALPQLHSPGQGWSYCNAGLVVAGRIAEVVTGDPWDKLVKQRLARPAGADSFVTLPEEALNFRAAVGHVADPSGAVRVAPWRGLGRASGPAGSTPYASVADLLAFARVHTSRGVSPKGDRVLSAAAVQEMQTRQVGTPQPSHPGGWGLGWALYDWGQAPVIGHNGGTLGQYSFLCVAPEKGLAVALLTNGGDAEALYRDLFTPLLDRFGGIGIPPLPVADPAIPIDPARFVGVYRKLSATIEVRSEGKVLHATVHNHGYGARPLEGTLAAFATHAFLLTLPGLGTPAQLLFTGERGAGTFTYAFFGGRLHKRSDG